MSKNQGPGIPHPDSVLDEHTVVVEENFENSLEGTHLGATHVPKTVERAANALKSISSEPIDPTSAPSPVPLPPPLHAAAAPAPAPRSENPDSQAPITGSPITGADTGDKSGNALVPGARVHHYELIRELGKGGMGSVFLARDTKLGRRVAIKFLHTENAELTQRFILEARTTARCSHENIVIIYEVDAHRGKPFMVLEYLQGKTLAESLKKGQRMPVPRSVEMMVPVVRALVCAHELGIVHRDLKPANILITDSGTIKVLDFGIAKVLQAESDSLEHLQEVRQKKSTADTAVGLQKAASGLDPENSNVDTGELTRHGAIMGTLPFMAPEQWRAGTPIDHRADIWALGIMLFRLLAGKHPLDPLVGEQLFVTGILNEPMPKLRTMAPDIPQALADVVDKCLMKKKEDRMPDAISLLRALEAFLPGRYRAEGDISENQSPYAGLASFQEADAHRFFGRTREVAAMVNRIGDRPIIGVVGTSGAGKSSFIRAGLVPALKRSGEAWDALVIRPGRKPLAALADIVAPLIAESTSASVSDDLKNKNELIEKLRNEPGYVGSVLRSRARREKKRMLLFIDQFEELYTLVADETERLAFTACLSGIADDATAPTRVVLSIRSDFLDRAAEDQTFMTELSQGLFFLNAPDRNGLRDALVQPAEMAGYKFERQEMVEHMLDHLEETPGALPLLQFAATQLWDRRDPARRLLTKESYEAIGGIAGALASHADAVLAELPEAGRKLARAVLLRLVTPERTRAIVSLEELREISKDSAEIQRLVDQLVQARLLVVQTQGGGSGTVEIVHESLIHSWPTLRRWLEEGQEDAAFMEQLRNAARQWNAKGKDSDLLWRGDVVEEAKRFQRRFRGELPEVQRLFLNAVFAQEAKSARRKQALIVGAGIFFALLFVASTVALVVIRRAQRDAEVQAIAAKNAEGVAKDAADEAKKRLIEVQAKEKERAEAQARAEEALAQAESARQQAEKSNEDLKSAMVRVQEAQKRALWAKQHSDMSAQEARAAREEAVKAAGDLQTLLAKEQERVKRLQSQLGSPVIETLK